MDVLCSVNLINYYILSWCEGEYLMVVQVEQVVEILFVEFGFVEYQVLYVLYQDIDNMYLYIVVNWVYFDMFKVIKLNRGFDKEVGYCVIVRIEVIQGWLSE